MFIGIFTVITVVGVITVDFGLWFSERRGAQTDADLPALAGARECMLQLATGQQEPGIAEQRIREWFNQNRGQPSDAAGVYCDEAGSGDVCIVRDMSKTECYDPGNGERCVDVVVKHKSKTLFSSFFAPVFEGVAGNIGAHARACAGAASSSLGTEPLETDTDTGECFDADGKPVFTSLCPLEYGSQGGPGGPNPRGIADLTTDDGVRCSQAKDSGAVAELLACGAGGRCIIDETPEAGTCPASKDGWFECASTQTGNPKKVLTGVQCRIQGGAACKKITCDGVVPAGEGICDTNHDGTDSFEETVNLIYDTGDPATSIYEPRDCDPDEEGIQVSPRLMNILVFNQYPSDNNKGYSIIGFAGFYLVGCGVHEDGAETGNQCDNDDDDDGDGKVNDGCPEQGNNAERANQCNNAVDDDGDGKVNDGCKTQGDDLEWGEECDNALNDDDDDDNKVNDGCPQYPVVAEVESQCDNDVDDDGDTVVNDGCPSLITGEDLNRECDQKRTGGHVVVFGKLVKLVTVNTGITPPNDSTTMFGIALTE